ncbi:hypothetical protein [Salinicola peritrichatus]|uniref:hypothetical protein n=1 Tax=Salinicola peritrichatus TaxID=1267424 RepID=UPI000DA15387|nr:hypothetical protein [Salinicola peritrichatus]
MALWLNHMQEEAALGIGLCALFLLYRRLPHPLVGIVAVGVLGLSIQVPFISPATSLLGACALLLAAIAVNRHERLPIWLASTLPSPRGNAEAAVQVTAHPVNGKLQVFHLSRWFEAILIDPANPPLREGEIVYLIRRSGRQAWVSRVRSHAPPSDNHRRWEWSLH